MFSCRPSRSIIAIWLSVGIITSLSVISGLHPCCHLYFVIISKIQLMMDKFLTIIAINKSRRMTIDVNELSLILSCCSHPQFIFKFKLAYLTYF